MTSNTTVYSLDKRLKFAFSAKVTSAILLLIFGLAQSTKAAEQEWWFDVEVILFERNVEQANVAETFKQSRLTTPSNDIIDLLTPYLHPDLSYLQAGLAYCRQSNQLAVKAQYEQDFAFPKPTVENNLVGTFEPEALEEVQLEATAEALPEENFEYQVATNDIFSKPEDAANLTITNDLEKEYTAGQEAQENESLVETADNTPRPPIAVNFIEWQLPTQLPCAYKEQIDPSLTFDLSKQNSQIANNATDNLKRLPEIINGTEWLQKRQAFLLPSSTMRMTDLYQKIKKQRDMSPLLHVNWRQEVKFGRENSPSVRLFAGKNFANQFTANGLAVIPNKHNHLALDEQTEDKFYLPEQEKALLSEEQYQALVQQFDKPIASDTTANLMDKIDAALADTSPIDFAHYQNPSEPPTDSEEVTALQELWQIDGGITVYLRRVGRVPYLHIDSDLDFRQAILDPTENNAIASFETPIPEQDVLALNLEAQANYLQSVNFNQLRRVISKQVHYFDHPLFGMIVVINRYYWPQQAADDEELEAQDN